MVDSVQESSFKPETYNQAVRATRAPFVSWDTFIADKFVWEPGEHVGLIGPTGQGKTTVLLQLIMLREYTVVFATKPRDNSMDWLLSPKRGRGQHIKLERWKSLDPDRYPHRVIWPDASKLGAIKKQREVFLDAFEQIYVEGGWTLGIDEAWVISNARMMGLETPLQIYLQQARSLDISLLCATQRPAHVPLAIYSMSTHLFLWKNDDLRDLSRLDEISVSNKGLIKELVSTLDDHMVLYVNTRTGAMMRTKAPRLEGV